MAQIRGFRWARQLPWLHRVQVVVLFDSFWAADFMQGQTQALGHLKLREGHRRKDLSLDNKDGAQQKFERVLCDGGVSGERDV